MLSGHSIITYAPNWPKFDPLPRTHISLLLRPPPLRTHSLAHLTPPPISNGNVFKYPISNSIEKKTVKNLRDRNVIKTNSL